MKPFTVALLSVVAFAGSASGQRDAGRIWITDVTIVSPENLDHIAEGNVLIEGGHIISVERGKGTRKPAGAAVVSGKGEVPLHQTWKPCKILSPVPFYPGGYLWRMSPGRRSLQ